MEYHVLTSRYILLIREDEQQCLLHLSIKYNPMQLLPGFTTPLIRADTTLRRLEYPYLITGYLPIPTLADAWRFLDVCGKKRAAVAWGKSLKLLHHIRFDLAGDLAYPEASGVRLSEDLEARWQTPLQLAIKDYMLDTPKLVAALKHGQRLVTDAPITLCHGHPDAKSFLFDGPSCEVRAALNFGNARRSDPLTDLASILSELEALGSVEAFMQGYGVLSTWEQARLGFYLLHHELQRYALALTHFPNKIALSRMRLADLLESAKTF